MEDTIIVALISGLLTLAGTVITVVATNRKTTQAYETSIARIDERVKNLTEEVRKHNNFAEKVPVLFEKIDVANHRISDLESDLKKLSEVKG
jgi:peptidoglycan hydrolase CwlO-like protein